MVPNYCPAWLEDFSLRLGSQLRVRMKYITTPIFYVNARPHIGHLHSMVLADVIHRWHRFHGRDSRFVTGTDEHGSKVASAASHAGKLPQLFTDELSSSFKQLATKANISYDRFIRTTDQDHIERCQDFWTTLDKNGYISKGHHEGWYCVSDETFYPESELEETSEGLVSKETGKSVEWQQEPNYFFDLPKLQPQLLERYATPFIMPSSRHQQILAEIKQPLSKLSISRPRSRCDWGIPVPNDPDHTMYVWFDALINYLTAADGYWPAQHIIGKDIMRFHCIYWPAFLMAAGLPLPTSVTVHNHWTMEGIKMSKSLNNVVDPIEAIDKYGLDTVRYFLIHDFSLDHDTPFSYARLVERHNVNLVNKLGNLASRVCGPKFNIKESLSVPCDPAQVEIVESALAECDVHAERHEMGKILVKLNDLAMHFNQYFQDAEPWKLSSEEQKQVVHTTAEACRIIGLYLTPFCPAYGDAILSRLAVIPAKRSGEFAKIGRDTDYGAGANKKGAIFQKL